MNTQEEERIVERSCDLYALARFKDGVREITMLYGEWKGLGEG